MMQGVAEEHSANTLIFCFSFFKTDYERKGFVFLQYLLLISK